MNTKDTRSDQKYRSSLTFIQYPQVDVFRGPLGPPFHSCCNPLVGRDTRVAASPEIPGAKVGAWVPVAQGGRAGPTRYVPARGMAKLKDAEAPAGIRGPSCTPNTAGWIATGSWLSMG